VVRDSELGVALAVFGELAPELSISTDPALTAADAARRATELGGDAATLLQGAELVIVPLDSGEYRLAYTTVVSAPPQIFRIFIDAQSGGELRRYSEIHTQSAVGTGQGLVGSRKKISVAQEGSAFFADDRLRPPTLRTYDMRFNLDRAFDVLEGALPAPSERAQDTDNDWTDVSAVDGHVHIGWSYDYFFKRFGRRGFNNADRPLTTVINALSQQQGATTTDDEIFGLFVVNAFWCPPCGPNGLGALYFGNGFPPQFAFPNGQNWAQLAGALDVAAHEYTHGITTFTSGLLPQNESGALNESFSDMMGTAIEYF
jgi:bacillolysin